MDDSIRAAFGSLIKQLGASALNAEDEGDDVTGQRIMEFRTELVKLRDRFLTGGGVKAPRKPRKPKDIVTDTIAEPAVETAAAPAVETPQIETSPPAAPSVGVARRRAA